MQREERDRRLDRKPNPKIKDILIKSTSRKIAYENVHNSR